MIGTFESRLIRRERIVLFALRGVGRGKNDREIRLERYDDGTGQDGMSRKSKTFT
jgi:hypothetical protein